jgi:ABC-type multidrug transport system fused ATPase/permease subunit
MLGRVIESEALESLALNSGVVGLVSVIELVMAAAVIALGAGGVAHMLLLLLWTALTLILAWRYFRASRDWTAGRLWMTQDLVERMVGHRTRLAQEVPERWHEGEDQALERYLISSREVDGAATWIGAAIPLGWIIVSLIGLAYPFVSGSSSTAQLAVGIGGTLLAWQAFRGITTGLWNVTGAAIAWKQVALLFQAAARPQLHGSPDLAVQPAPREKQTLVDVQNVVFRHQGRTEPVLCGCNLRIVSGDRLVLEGPSGEGKSTLGSLLAGLRAPDAGLLLAGGLDRSALGFEGWRRVVALAPQFHENHVLSGPFAFNLLMGRDGVLDERNLEEAEAICHELGLRELLARMPGGIMQMVGESGWQLSHGERSRLFIARALLQGAEVIVLDECFAALDPANLRLAIDCVARHAQAALVIAHR